VNGAPIGQEFAGRPFRGVPIDPADPPQYESQAAYLKRLGLLTAEERRALGPEAFEPEVVRPAPDEVEDDDAEDEEDDDGGHHS
jgi:hypothetical protein